MAQAPCFFYQLASARVNEIKVFGIFLLCHCETGFYFAPFPEELAIQFWRNWRINFDRATLNYSYLLSTAERQSPELFSFQLAYINPKE